MANIFDNDKEFKASIGAFVIAFSEFEFGLNYLCDLTEFDLYNKDYYVVKYLGMTFESKMKTINDYIDIHMKEFSLKWERIKSEVGPINKERRYIVHGFMDYYLPNESIRTYVKEKGEIISKDLSIKHIKNLTNKLHHLNNGEHGIKGQFHIDFTKRRVDKWNELVNDKFKIVYKVNSDIVSEWKG
ncbi:hypothetical protein GCM10027036_34790 [Flavihumibacter cheonanensis]|uniref:hypothetical protein n=1 Tax=Flavihumibacter cheonanensis TaxID=1442385 RepID=UPI001EF8CBB2|nr:hypothetical protein [Flavihumibacter cheonanensis]MCG7753483.1 hypothetical protein [Flavihumibacter cheonanensis]